MKRKPLTLSLFTISLLLTGCAGTKEDSSSSESPSSSNGDSASYDGDFDLWEESEKELMMTYCGTLLPHPFDMIEGPMHFEEQESGGEKCLVLYNFAEEWTLKDYYLSLESFGWETIKGYDGEIVQDGGGSSYVELTREGSDGQGYELMYYYVDGSLNEGDSYNCIVCFSSYTSNKTEKTSWDEKEVEAISYVTSTSLPFFALGENYRYGKASESELDFYDYCSKDLSREIVSTLQGDGFALDEEKCEEYGCYYVWKNLPEGGKIEILVRYLKGNNVYVYFTPKMEESSSWPSAFLTEAETILGSSIPVFKIAKGGSYSTYTLHGTSYVITYDLDASFDYYSYIENINSELFSWEEKLEINAYLLVDEEGEETGFLLQFKPSDPLSVFSSSWPSKDIEAGVKDALGVEGVEIPSLDLASYNLAKDMKYQVVTEEDYRYVYEEALALYKENYGDVYSLPALESMAKAYADRLVEVGVRLSFYDSTLDTPIDYVVRYKINEAYKDLLYRSGWYLVPDTGSRAYEDPTGQIRIEVNNDSLSSYGYTSISITKGSGEAHSPTFKFSQDSYKAGTGNSFTPILQVSMLPYEVTYSCSDATGKVSIDPASGLVSVSIDAEVGSTCEISATCTDDEGLTYTAKAEIEVVKAANYQSNLEEVEALLKEQGYFDYTKEDIYAIGSTTEVRGKKLTLNFGQSLSKQEVKDLVEDHLVPEKFISGMWSKEDEDAYSSPSLGPVPSSFAKKKKAKYTDEEYLYCFRIEDYASFSLTYYVHTETNKDIILIVESRRYR